MNTLVTATVESPVIVKTDEELLRWYQCGRKLVYEDGVSAERMAQSITCTTPITQYKCHYCYGWHVGKIGSRLTNRKRQLRRATRSWLRYGLRDQIAIEGSAPGARTESPMEPALQAR